MAPDEKEKKSKGDVDKSINDLQKLETRVEPLEERRGASLGKGEGSGGPVLSVLLRCKGLESLGLRIVPIEFGQGPSGTTAGGTTAGGTTAGGTTAGGTTAGGTTAGGTTAGGTTAGGTTAGGTTAGGTTAGGTTAGGTTAGGTTAGGT